MPRKGMRSVFFHPNPSESPNSPASPSSSSHPHSWPSSPRQPSFSDSLMDGNVAAAESIIAKWDPASSSYAKVTSLFHENRREAAEFLQAARDLQRSMHFYIRQSPTSEKLIHAQVLMQTAMNRLQKEFYQILAANRDMLDPDSSASDPSSTTTRSSVSDYEDDLGSEDEIQMVRNSIQEMERAASTAMSDLRAIAECMIACGYGRECVRIYNNIRKSIVEEAIYRLGWESPSSKHLEKMDWNVLERRTKIWMNAMKSSLKTLFYRERVLCNQVFRSSNSIRESCFSEIAKEVATQLLRFPEAVSKSKKYSPEKIFRFLDMYATIAELWPDIESVFSSESTSAVRTQAISSLIKLGDGIRTMLYQFESAIQKDSSRVPVPGGSIHPLTRYVMNYLCFLSDYTEILIDICPEFQQQSQALLQNSPAAENSDPQSAMSTCLEWLILALLCKLDRKAELYKDIGLSCLFLANNLNYVVSKVNGSNLRYMVGDEWISKHTSRVQQYTASYRSISWKKVISALPEDAVTADMFPQAAKKHFQEFKSALEAACGRQSGWVVPDERLRAEIRDSVSKMLVAGYRLFYEKYKEVLVSGQSSYLLGFTAEDLESRLAHLFSR
ncbi:hypothetical protein ACLOJK_001652 [Asimina triloba]